LWSHNTPPDNTNKRAGAVNNDSTTIRPPTVAAIAEEAVREAFASCLDKIIRNAAEHYPTAQIGTAVRAFSKAAHERLTWMRGIEDAEEAAWRARADAKAMQRAERVKERANKVAQARRAAMHLIVDNTAG
jgi:hypothetical protein